ncbi:MAG: STT3 domain-containing protein [Promethearchaeota archaeon]
MSYLDRFAKYIRKRMVWPKTELSVVIQYILLFMIFSIALLIRLFPFFRFEPLLKAFDPWFQYRVAEYVAKNGYLAYFSWYDTISWYPYGRAIWESSYPGTPFAAATIYFILRALGLNVELLMVCYVFPALMGATTCLLLYFFGKEIADAKTGLIAAFLLAFCPAYISRTMAGFFDNEALGVFLTVATFYFFIKSEKNGSIRDGILAGLSLGALSASWGAFTFAFGLIPLVTIALLLFNRYSHKLLLSYSLTILIALNIAVHVPRTGVRFITSFTGFLPLTVLVILFFYGLIQWTIPLLPDVSTKKLVAIAMIVILGCIIGVLSYLFSEGQISLITGKFLAVINPVNRPPLIESVSEHIPLAWGQLFFNLDLLVILMPVGVYFAFRRFRDDDIFLIIFCISTVYFAGAMVRLLLILAPIACLLSAFALTRTLKPFSRVLLERAAIVRRRGRVTEVVPKDYAVFMVIFIGFMMTLYTWHGTQVAFNYFSSPDVILVGETSSGQPLQLHDWQEAMQWLREETDEDAVIAAWWDYGYWIEAIGNRTTLVDNATTNSTQIAWVGAALMSTPENATKIFKMLGADYVLVHFTGAVGGTGGDEGKWTWMTKIAEQQLFNETKIKYSDYYDEETGTPKDPYYDSLLYQLLYYQFPQAPRPVSGITSFQEVHKTQNWLVRIYQVN